MRLVRQRSGSASAAPRVFPSAPLVVPLLILLTAAAAGAEPRACLSGRAIDSQRRLAVEAKALRTLRLTAQRQADQLWTLSHPVFRDRVTKPRLPDWMAEQSPRLSQLSAARASDVWIVPGRGGAPQMEVHRCRSRGAPPDVDTRVRLEVGDEDIAIVFVRMPGRLLGRVAAVRLRKLYGDWRFERVDFGVDRYQGQSAEQFAARAEDLMAGGELLRAVVNLDVAALLSMPAPYVLTPFLAGVLGRRTEVVGKPAYDELLGRWDAGGHRVAVKTVTAEPVGDGFAVTVLYVTPKSLASATTKREARALRRVLNERHPDLAFQFETVVFRAYRENPVDPNKDYESSSATLPLLE